MNANFVNERNTMKKRLEEQARELVYNIKGSGIDLVDALRGDGYDSLLAEAKRNNFLIEYDKSSIKGVYDLEREILSAVIKCSDISDEQLKNAFRSGEADSAKGYEGKFFCLKGKINIPDGISKEPRLNSDGKAFPPERYHYGAKYHIQRDFDGACFLTIAWALNATNPAYDSEYPLKANPNLCVGKDINRPDRDMDHGYVVLEFSDEETMKEHLMALEPTKIRNNETELKEDALKTVLKHDSLKPGPYSSYGCFDFEDSGKKISTSVIKIYKNKDDFEPNVCMSIETGDSKFTWHFANEKAFEDYIRDTKIKMIERNETISTVSRFNGDRPPKQMELSR